MDKNDLLGALTNIRNNFILGLVFLNTYPIELLKKVSEQQITLDGPRGAWFKFDLQGLRTNMADEEKRRILLAEFEKGLKRAITAEGHELVLMYCEETNQIEKYKAVSWFQFARILRNVNSHKQGGYLTKWPDDLAKKNITEVSWRHRTMKMSMIGQPIEFMNYDILLFFEDLINFVQQELQ